MRTADEFVDKTKTIATTEIDLIPIFPFLDLVHMLVIATKELQSANATS